MILTGEQQRPVPGQPRLGSAPEQHPQARGGPQRSRWRARTALLRWLCALVPLGCASRVASPPPAPEWLDRPSGSIHLSYSRLLVAPERQRGEPYERGGVELDVTGRRVFVGSSDHGMYALDATDGSSLWRFETLGPVQSRALYDAASSSLYFGSNDGALYKVGAERGLLKWRFATGAEVTRRAVLHRGVAYVVNANDTVLAINAQSGALIWTYHRTPAFGIEVAGHAGPLLWRGLVYVAFSDGTVTALDAQNGEERWLPVDLAAAAEQTQGSLTYLDTDTTPVPGRIGGAPVIYVASYEGGVFALDADSGRIVWTHPGVEDATALVLWRQPAHRGRAGAAPAPARSLLIASTGTDGLWALDPGTGQQVWHQTLPEHAGGVSRAVPVLGALLFATTRHGLLLASPLDGRLIDAISTGEGFSMPPAAHGRRFFILSNGGRFYSFQISPPLAAPQR